eukprot:scaffold119135_cov20-Tisochrysis_lutea.AAC.2
MTSISACIRACQASASSEQQGKAVEHWRQEPGGETRGSGRALEAPCILHKFHGAFSHCKSPHGTLIAPSGPLIAFSYHPHSATKSSHGTTSHSTLVAPT